eukprot:3053189-Ditylum_brightwellii.AAC.1
MPGVRSLVSVHLGGKCQSKCIVYKVLCKACEAFYIGATQDDFEWQITGHSMLLKNYLDEKPDTKVSKSTKHLVRKDQWPELSTSVKSAP